MSRLSEAIAPARRRIPAASRAVRRRAANLLRRCGDRRGSPLADEAAGAFRAHPFPPLAGRLRRACAPACSQCNEEFVEGRIALYDEAGPAVRARRWLPRDQRLGQSAASRRAGRHARCALSRRLGTHAARAGPRRVAPLPLDVCKPPHAHALDEVIAIRGRAELRGRAWPPATTSPPRSSRAVCARWASTAGASFTADSLRVAASMRPVFERLMANLAKRGLLEERRRRLPPDAGTSPTAADSAQEALRAFICEAFRPPARGPALRGKLRRTRPDPARRKGRRAGAVRRRRRGVARSILRRRPLHQPLAGRDRRGGAGSGARICRKAADCASSKSARGTGGLAAHVLPLLERGLHSYTFTDVSAGFFPGAHAKAGGLPRSRMQDFRSRKTGHRAGLRGGLVRLHHRHQRAARRERRARDAAAICTTCSRRAAASSSWTSRRRSCGRKRSSA